MEKSGKVSNSSHNQKTFPNWVRNARKSVQARVLNSFAQVKEKKTIFHSFNGVSA